MILRELEVQNFMSLEHVTLKGLDLMNVLIGRNNVGKSAVFRAVEHLAAIAQGHGLDNRLSARESALITDGSTDPSLIFRLRFDLSAEDREEFLRHLAGWSQHFNPNVYRESPFLRWVEYTFRSLRDRPTVTHLIQTRTVARNGNEVIVQRVNDLLGLQVNNPSSTVVNYEQLVGASRTFDSQQMMVGSPDALQYLSTLNINCNDLAQLAKNAPPSIGWLQSRVGKFLSDCFFFSPFRRCTARLQVQESQRLLPNGENLANVLDTVQGNDRDRFAAIERFVQAAVPDLGLLHAPLRGQARELGFNRPGNTQFVHVHEMGGGLEQLLMVATLLQTTSNSCSLFIEEPESHLHPEAQRYLRDRLAADGRQVFITSHSPVFLNSPTPQSVYRVRSVTRRTQIEQVDDPEGLGEVLEEIGVRNSDVLLADAVAFVEGDGDEVVIRDWADTLGKSLTAGRVTVLPMGGGRDAHKHAPMRSELLAEISEKAPVPHLFVIDRDERPQAEADKLQTRLQGVCHILARRELENYLLCPRAVLAALKEKHANDAKIKAQLDTTDEAAVEKAMRSAAEGLRKTVLIRRIKWEVPGVPGGVFPDEKRDELSSIADESDLADRIKQVITTSLSSVTLDGIPAMVDRNRAEVTADWADPERQMQLAPGEEILTAVFNAYGSNYSKKKDGERIARAMRPEEIPEEIRTLIERILNLPQGTQN